MSRTKLIPDSDVHTAILALLESDGEKAVAFSSVGRATGLAPATLVQRFGSRDAMLRAAILAGWDRLGVALTAAEATPLSPKGALKLLKSLPSASGLLNASLRDAGLREQAATWRKRVEAALEIRLGDGSQASGTAAILFALWHGQSAWNDAGGKGFRLKDAVKRLT